MIKILDCTLRDGGYYTNWDFDKSLVAEYAKLTSHLPIEYLEIGYTSLEKEGYFGEYFYTPIESLEIFQAELNETQKISLMLNAKDILENDIDNLMSKYILKVNLVRIATDPEKIDSSIKIAQKLHKLGFKVAINLMYVSNIGVDHPILRKLTELENFIDVLYLVDSYGTIYPEQLVSIIQQFKKHTSIPLGFHGHNNLELAFINTLTAIYNGVQFVDSTVLGMGRGAGNTKLELLLTYFKSKNNMEFNYNLLAELVELFKPLLQRYQWGTNFPYMISGSYSLPQKDVMEAIEIDRYSISSLVSSLNKEETKKLEIFEPKESIENCLIVGGGSTVREHFTAVKNFLAKNPHIVIIHSSSRHIDLFQQLSHKQLLCIAGDELTKLHNIKNINNIYKLILEPSPRKINVNLPVLSNICELRKICIVDQYQDSPLAISLQTAVDLNASIIQLIGFDAYMEVKKKKELRLMQENQYIITTFSSANQKLTSLTSSNYKDLIQMSLYSRI